MNSENNQKIINNLFWKFLERGGTQGIQFLVQIFLARLLLPEDYGVISLIIIFISIANVFVQSGFSTALIQKKNIDELDISSVFYVSMLIAVIVYIALFFSAPLISSFFNEPSVVPVLRVLSITLFFGAINSIQNVVISRAMQFKKFFLSSLSGNILSGILGILMAYMNFGVWALVWQQLANNIIITLVLWFTVKWRPKLMFSKKRIKVIFSFGSNLLISSLIDTIYTNVYGIVIGKMYNPQMLGYYQRGEQFPKIIVTNVNGSISSVLLPVLSANQEDKNRVKIMVRKSINISSFIMSPIMIGLAVCAEPIVSIVLTDKWLPSVPFIQVMCISYIFWPIHTANLQAINALGRSDIFLKLEILKKFIGIVVLLVSIPFGVYVMVGLQPIVSFISTIINSYPNKKLLNYSSIELAKDIVPSLSISLIMGAIVYLIKYLSFSDGVTLSIQIVVGILLYLILSKLFNYNCLKYLIDNLISTKNSRHKEGAYNNE